MPQQAINLSLEEVARHFHLPIKEAAEKLGVSMTVIKKICRRNNIKRWPHRKLQSLQKRIQWQELKVNSSGSSFERSILVKGLNNLSEKKQNLMSGLMSGTPKGSSEGSDKKDDSFSSCSDSDSDDMDDVAGDALRSLAFTSAEHLRMSTSPMAVDEPAFPVQTRKTQPKAPQPTQAPQPQPQPQLQPREPAQKFLQSPVLPPNVTAFPPGPMLAHPLASRQPRPQAPPSQAMAMQLPALRCVPDSACPLPVLEPFADPFMCN